MYKNLIFYYKFNDDYNTNAYSGKVRFAYKCSFAGINREFSKDKLLMYISLYECTMDTN